MVPAEESATGGRRDPKDLDEDEVRLDELLDDLAIDADGDEPEQDEEGDPVDASQDPVLPSPQQEEGKAAGSVFEFNPSGMKFV